jgi:quercetin dioxygenase-like cupin family protein
VIPARGKTRRRTVWLPHGQHTCEAAPQRQTVTIHVECEPGAPGTPPHRHSGPSFGYVIEGAVRFEGEGDPERMVKAGGTCWKSGSGVGATRHECH